MKVRSATQVLSDSLVDAFECFNKNLKLNQFEGAEETVKFIRVINKAFDVLNLNSLSI